MTLKETEEWIRHSNLIEGVDELVEDRRSLRAWQWLVEGSPKYPRPWCLQTVLTLHERIMKAKIPLFAGKLRDVDVRVGPYVAPVWKEVAWKLVHWIGYQDDPMHKLTVQCIQRHHVEFERIHPFVDGNGRTGRMLMNWQRVLAGLFPLCIRVEDRQEYYAWFRTEFHPSSLYEGVPRGLV